jgi:Flp pilus assembly protein TadB
MLDRLQALAALAAGICFALAVLQMARPQTVGEAARWLNRRHRRASGGPISAPLPRLPARAQTWLVLRLDRAGWAETPDRFTALAGLAAVALGAGGAVAGSLGDGASSIVLAGLGSVLGAGLSVQFLLAAGAARRRRLLAELAPTLELTCLELGAGSSPASALVAVTRRTGGELSRELRLILAGSALASTESLDARLRRLGERLDLGPLTSVAAVLATSRDYGSGVMHGLRAIAVDLRRAQRRELIAASRSALTRILVPAAVGVLMPFMAILLYPAVTTLAANLR